MLLIESTIKAELKARGIELGSRRFCGRRELTREGASLGFHHAHEAFDRFVKGL